MAPSPWMRPRTTPARGARAAAEAAEEPEEPEDVREAAGAGARAEATTPAHPTCATLDMTRPRTGTAIVSRTRDATALATPAAIAALGRSKSGSISGVKTTVLALILTAATAARADTPPLSPEQSRKTITVPPGFRVDLVAAEPMVMDPVAVAVDENGILYVAEMGDYPLGPPAGKIKRLEDTDGDGRADKMTIFAEGLPYPNSVMPWKGGLLVTAAPNIVYLKDENGDGRADRREVVFTGFVEGNQQHLVNTLVLGIDNWIYGANGGAGGTINNVSIRGSDFRFRPDFSGFELVSGQSQYGNTFDDAGNRFIADNSHHIRQAPMPRRYLARNPHLPVPSIEEDIPDHGAAGEVFPTSELAERPNDQKMAGHFTSACSVTVYRAHAFPAAYRGNSFVCEPVHNLVHRDVLAPKGIGFVARRGEDKREFLASTDGWFRPVNLYAAPDGSLYVVDMYRAVIEHPKWIPQEMQRRVDLRAGADKGRIWRVSPEGLRPVRVALGRADARTLAQTLAHPDAWWRTTAQRLLIERQNRAAVPGVKALLRGKAPLGRLHALWTLDGLSALDADTIARSMTDPDATVRTHAIRLAEPRLASSAPLRKRLLALAADPSATVRFQAALSLGELHDEAALRALARVAAKDLEDRWTRLAVLTGIASAAPGFLRLLQAVSPKLLTHPTPGALALVRQLGALAARDSMQARAWSQLVATEKPEPWRVVALAALRRQGVPMKDGWGERILALALDRQAEVPDRVNALELLAARPPGEASRDLGELMRPQEPREVQVAAVRLLAALPGYPFAARVLENWPRHTAAVRQAVLGALLDGAEHLPALTAALEKGTIRPAELDPPQRERLTKAAPRMAKLLEPQSSPEREKAIGALTKQVLALKGNALEGEKVFTAACAVCHRMSAQGYNVGPSLETVAGRDRSALLVDILNPNRALAPQYQVYVVKTAKQELSGIIAVETPTSVTIRQAMAVDTTVLRDEIKEITAWPASLMPDGLEANTTPQNLADLLVFLGAK